MEIQFKVVKILVRLHPVGGVIAAVFLGDGHVGGLPSLHEILRRLVIPGVFHAQGNLGTDARVQGQPETHGAQFAVHHLELGIFKTPEEPLVIT